jgi:hypothetical protein
MTTAFSTTPVMGVDITSTSSLATGSLTVYSPEWTVGGKVIMSDGGEHVYIKCAATITAGDVLQITPGTSSATGITTTLASANTTTAGTFIGVANTSLVVGQHGWACLRGVPYAGINIGSSCNKGTPLYTTATAGQLNTTSTSVILVSGIESTVTTTSAAVVAGYCSNPLLVTGVVNNL